MEGGVGRGARSASRESRGYGDSGNSRSVPAHAAMQRYLKLSYGCLTIQLKRRARPRAAASAALTNVLTCPALPEP
jgi:hypothetical protein